jgi:hypothetical protein
VAPNALRRTVAERAAPARSITIATRPSEAEPGRDAWRVTQLSCAGTVTTFASLGREGRPTHEARERKYSGGHVVGVGELAGGDHGEQFTRRWCDHLDLITGAQDDEAGRLEPIDAPSRIEAQRRADSA